MQTLNTGIYQHYKGPFYLVLGEALDLDERIQTLLGQAMHSETGMTWYVYVNEQGLLRVRPTVRVRGAGQGELFAVYVPLYPHKGEGLCIRPLKMFEEGVEVDERGLIPRFAFMGNQFPYLAPPSYSPLSTDEVIGKLDRVLSELLILCERPDLDEADYQTLKHHADDLIGVGAKAQGILFDRKRGQGLPVRTNEAHKEESVECIFTKDGDFVALSDANVRESTETDHYHVRSISRAEYDEAVEGRLRVYADGRMERPHR